MDVLENLEALRDALPPQHARAIQIVNDAIGYIKELQLHLREENAYVDTARGEVQALHGEIELLRNDLHDQNRVNRDFAQVEHTANAFRLVLEHVAHCQMARCPDCSQRARDVLGITPPAQ